MHQSMPDRSREKDLTLREFPSFACQAHHSSLSNSRPAHQGEVAEWSIASVLKTEDGKPSVGSNPTLSAILRFLRKLRMASHWLLEKDAKNALRSPAKRDEVGLVLS